MEYYACCPKSHPEEMVSNLYFSVTLLIISISCLVAFELHINRYFLQVDNIFDYKKYSLMGLTSNIKSSMVSEHWISQPLDHFNPIEDTFFWQRYLFLESPDTCPDTLPKTPICIFIGGDAEIQTWWLQHTFLAAQCVEKLKAHVFLLEHRFYGQSMPVVSHLNLDSLKYLTVNQSLEDVAALIMLIKKHYKLEKNKIIVFGASYGGALAALFRRKYPHLADSAVALSAPMYRDFQNKEYLPSIGKKIKKVDRKCYMQIEHGLRQAVRLMDNHICAKKENTLCERIQQNLGLCTSLKSMTKLERRIFFGTLIKDFAFLVEFDGVLNVTLKNICDVISHPEIENWSPMDKLLAGDIVISQELFNSKTRANGARECLVSRKQDICKYLSNTEFKHEANVLGRRQRLWQSCSELGSFRTSAGDTKQHPFGDSDTIPGSFHQDICSCAFGPNITQTFINDRLRDYSKTFGPFISFESSGSKIIYTIGEADPVLQRELKLAEKPGNKAKYSENVIFKIKNSAHCGEVFSKPARRRIKGKHLTAVQQEIVDQLAVWMNSTLY